jgi:hypothetical protein
MIGCSLAGSNPIFPDRAPPSRAKPLLAVLLTVFAAVLVVLAMCVGIIAGLQVLGYDVRPEGR